MGSRSSPILVNFGPGVSPQGQKVKFDNALDSRDAGVTNWPVTVLRLIDHRWLGQHVGIYTS